MGLDMYLYLSKYESESRWKEEKIKNFYPSELDTLFNMIYEHNFCSKITEYQVAYWRKANAIHNWIIQNCANGVDECQKIYVSEDDLKQLINLCEKVLKDNSLASLLLPTCDGFFFGSQKYDEWYFKDLEYTIEVLKEIVKVLESSSDYECYYRAS